MKIFFTLLGLFLMSRKIMSDNDGKLNEIFCRCTKNNTNDIQFTCNEENDDSKYFLIDMDTQLKTLECFESSNWESFNINSPVYFNNAQSFLVRNCQFKTTTDSSNFAKMINADKSKLMLIKMNTNKETVLNDNLFRGFRHLQILDITYNYKLVNLNDDTFKYLPQLAQLYLSHTELNEIPENLFQPTPNLRIMSLKGTSIKIIKPNTFRNLIELYTLNLEDNELENITVDTFKDLINLRALNLSNNTLQNLPANIFATMNKLTELYIGGNELENISKDAFLGLNNLSFLHMIYNKLKIFPNGVWRDLNNLQILNIQNNQLRTISKYVVFVTF